MKRLKTVSDRTWDIVAFLFAAGIATAPIWGSLIAGGGME